MEAVIRSAAMYFFLLVIFRLSGKRTLAQITTFDFILLLIVSEATQNALIQNNFSMTYAFLVIITLVGIDIALSLLKQRWPLLDRWIEGVPLAIVENGQPLRENMRHARVDESDILTAARERQGLATMDEIGLAVLERNGQISIVPNSESAARSRHK
jgi:uncharacterized membrane protein YcaP (DUF421 family)